MEGDAAAAAAATPEAGYGWQMTDVNAAEHVFLATLCVTMFAGAFAAGYIPLVCSMSASRMRMIAVLGAGLLVGAALVIIIPEGIQMWFANAAARAAAESEAGHDHDHDHEGHEGHEGHDHGGHAHQHHWQIGAALAFGFGMMLVVDKFSGGYGHSHGPQPLPSANGATVHRSTDKGNSSAMLGLIVHAAVDGVALGASTATGGDASLLVFLAIMLHKAPAAFGLTTYLMQNGVNSRGVKSQLLIFSLAAPVGAFLTFYGMRVGLLSYQQEWLALIMIFSGGTFLFVATAHILPEIMHTSSGKLTWPEVAVVVSGVIAPLFINLEHGH